MTMSKGRNVAAEAHHSFSLGTVAELCGDERRAIAYYRSEIRQTSYYKAHYNLGLLLMKRRRFRDAVRQYRQALKHPPDRSSASIIYNALAVAYSKIGRVDQALAAYRQSIRRNPSDPLPQVNAALELFEHGDRSGGERWLNRAIRQRPGNRKADELIGYALIEYDIDVRKGVQVLERVLGSQPDNLRVTADLAVGYLKLGDARRATQTAQRANRLNDGDREISRQVRLVTTLASRGRRSRRFRRYE